MQAAQSLAARSVFVAPRRATDVRDFSEEEEAVRAVFAKVGSVVSIVAQYDARVRRFGFTIEYASITAAQAAAQLDGITLRGRELGVLSVHAAQPMFESVGEGDGGAAVDKKAAGTALVPKNEEMPEALQLMPALVEKLPDLGDFVPLPPAAAPADADAAEAADGDGRGPLRDKRIHELMERKPGAAIVADLAAEQARHLDLLKRVAELQHVVAEERKRDLERRREIERIAAAKESQPGLFKSVWAPHSARLQRTIVVVACPADTVAIHTAIRQIAKFGAIRTFGTLPQRLKTPEGCIDIAIEFCDDGPNDAVLRPRDDPEDPYPAMVLGGDGPVLYLMSANEFGMSTSLAPGRVPRGKEAVVRAAAACLELDVT